MYGYGRSPPEPCATARPPCDRARLCSPVSTLASDNELTLGFVADFPLPPCAGERTRIGAGDRSAGCAQSRVPKPRPDASGLASWGCRWRLGGTQLAASGRDWRRDAVSVDRCGRGRRCSRTGGRRLRPFSQPGIGPLVEPHRGEEQPGKEQYENHDGRSPPPPHTADQGVVEVLPEQDAAQS